MRKSYEARTVQSVLVAASTGVVFDYIANPQTCPEWVQHGGVVRSLNRPMTQFQTFDHEPGLKRECCLRWTVTRSSAPFLWQAESSSEVKGGIVLHYAFEGVGGETRLTRIMHARERPRPLTTLEARRMARDAIEILNQVQAKFSITRLRISHSSDIKPGGRATGQSAPSVLTFAKIAN